MGQALVDFVMNSPVEVLIIGTVAYLIVGRIMRFFRHNFHFSFGKDGGWLLWFAVALMISVGYHWIKNLFA